jgi:hypothetical protein
MDSGSLGISFSFALFLRRELQFSIHGCAGFPLFSVCASAFEFLSPEDIATMAKFDSTTVQ